MKDFDETKENTFKYLEEGQLGKALEYVTANSKDHYKYRELVILSSRFKKNQAQFRNGLVLLEMYNINNNRIKRDLIYMIHPDVKKDYQQAVRDLGVEKTELLEAAQNTNEDASLEEIIVSHIQLGDIHSALERLKKEFKDTNQVGYIIMLLARYNRLLYNIHLGVVSNKVQTKIRDEIARSILSIVGIRDVSEQSELAQYLEERLEKRVERLLAFFEDEDEKKYKAELLLLQSKFEELKKEKKLGIILDEDYSDFLLKLEDDISLLVEEKKSNNIERKTIFPIFKLDLTKTSLFMSLILLLNLIALIIIIFLLVK